MEGKPKCTLFKTYSSAIGIISGASIFVTFIAYHNVHAAVWGLISAIFAATNLRMHLCYRKNRLHLRYTQQSLALLKMIGLFSTIATFIASITYFVLASVLKQGYKLEDDGYAPAGIFSLLTLKFTLMMFFSGRTYEKFIMNYSLIEDGCISSEDSPPPYNSI